MDEPNMNDRAEAALAERKLLGVTDEEWSHAMGLACEMAANGSKLGAAIIVIKAIREAVKQEREAIFEEICKVGDGAFMQLYGKTMGVDEYRGVTSAVAVMRDTVRARMAVAIRARSVVKDGLTPREVQG